MDAIVDILAIQDLTLEQSRQYTTESYDPDAVLDITAPNDEAFREALQVLRRSDVDMKSPNLLPVATACLYTINTSQITSDKISATKLLLHLCAQPGAAAYGIANSNVTLRIAEFLLKVIVDEINSKLSKSTKKVTASQEDEDDEDDMPARKSRRYALESETLHSLLQYFQQCFTLYEQSEASILDMGIEVALAVVSLAGFKSHFQTCGELADIILSSACARNHMCMMAVYRHALPIVTLAGRDQKLPENSKHRAKCHERCVDMLEVVYRNASITAAKWKASIDMMIPTSGPTLEAAPSDDVDTENATDTMSTPYTCATGLLQRFLLSGPERYLSRATVVASVQKLVSALKENSDHNSVIAILHIVNFINKLMKSAKTPHRSVAIDVAACFVNFSWIWEITEATTAIMALLYNVISRCNDVVATIRTRALISVCDIMNDLAAKKEMANLKLSATMMEYVVTGRNSLSLLDIFRKLVNDEKTGVRVRGIHALGVALSMYWPKPSPLGNGVVECMQVYMSDEDVVALGERCRDVSVAVRKEAVNVLSELLLCRPADAMLQQQWVNAVMPLAMDPESTVQAKVASCTYDIIIARAILEDDVNVWKLCGCIASTDRCDMLRSIVANMIRSNLLKYDGKDKNMSQITKSIRRVCGKVSNSELPAEASTTRSMKLMQDDSDIMISGAWILLDALLSQDTQLSTNNQSIDACVDAGTAEFVANCFLDRRAITAGFSLDDNDARMLRIIQKLSVRLSKTSIGKLSSEIMKVLVHLDCSCDGLAAAIAALCSLHDQAHLPRVIGQLLNVAYDMLYQFAHGEKPSDALYSDSPRSQGKVNQSESAVSAALFIVGEIAMIGFNVEEDEDAYVKLVSREAVSASLPRIVHLDGMKQYKVEISSAVATLMQLLMAYKLPSYMKHSNVSLFGADESLSMVQNNSMQSTDAELRIPPAIRAQAFVSMGKYCLRSKGKAREYLNVFLRELQYQQAQDDGSEAVRSNALIVLGDMCVRYTSLVERHVGTLAACLQDPHVMVRRHSFILLTQLLLQEYLKWRGMLLFRFLTTVLDTDDEMATLARHVLKNTLQTKYHDIAAQHFAESIIVFNGCQDHPMYVAVSATGTDATVSMDGINLEGAANRSRRQQIYEYILEDITEEQKIQITAKIVQDILSYILDKFHTLSSNPKLENVLYDAFLILRSPALKVGAKKTTTGTEEEDEIVNEEMDGNAMAAAKAAFTTAKNKVLKKLSLQHLIDHILPVVFSLKHALENIRSPMQRMVMEYLLHIVKTHKTQVAQVLAQDPALKVEIEYDLKMFEKEKAADVGERRIASAERAVVRLEVNTGRKQSIDGKMPTSVVRMAPISSTPLIRSRMKVLSTRQMPKSTQADQVSASLSKVHFDPSVETDEFIDRLTQNDQDVSPVKSNPRRWSVSIVDMIPEQEKEEFAVPQGTSRKSLDGLSEKENFMESNEDSSFVRHGKKRSKHQQEMLQKESTASTGRRNKSGDSLLSLSQTSTPVTREESTSSVPRRSRIAQSDSLASLTKKA